MGKPAVAEAEVELSVAEQRELQSLARASKPGQAMACRARLVLAAATGLENKPICVEVGADANTVGKWRRRFASHRLEGLLDGPRPGTPRKIGDDEVAGTIRKTLETTPPGATHGSLRSMAKAVGYAPATRHRIRHGHPLPLSETSIERIQKVPRPDRGQRSRRHRCASRDGQLDDPQDQGNPGLVRKVAALAGAHHADRRFLDQSGRAVLYPHHRQADPARRASRNNPAFLRQNLTDQKGFGITTPDTDPFIF